MYMFEIMRWSNFRKLSYDRQRFFVKIVKSDVEKAAAENGMSPERVYYWYLKGLYGGDRRVEASEC